MLLLLLLLLRYYFYTGHLQLYSKATAIWADLQTRGVIFHSITSAKVTVRPKFLFVLLKMTEFSSSGFSLSVVVRILDTIAVSTCVLKFTIIYNNHE
jgi:hypothetical protein